MLRAPVCVEMLPPVWETLWQIPVMLITMYVPVEQQQLAHLLEKPAWAERVCVEQLQHVREMMLQMLVMPTMTNAFVELPQHVR